MNPLSRNPGTAPAVPITDVRSGWNGWTHRRTGGCASYLVGVRSLLDRILSTSTFYARDLEGAVKQCRCTGLSEHSLNTCASSIIYRVYDCTCIYLFYTNRSQGFYYLVKKVNLRTRNSILNIYIGLLLINTTKQKQKQKNLITMGEYNSISSRDFSALRIYMRKTQKFNHRACAAT